MLEYGVYQLNNKMWIPDSVNECLKNNGNLTTNLYVGLDWIPGSDGHGPGCPVDAEPRGCGTGYGHDRKHRGCGGSRGGCVVMVIQKWRVIDV